MKAARIDTNHRNKAQKLKPSSSNSAVDLLLFQLKAARLPKPETEYKFHLDRKWRFDIAWYPRQTDTGVYPARKVAVEIDGGTWLPKGRHTTGAGFERDCEKLNTATVMGWRVLRVTPKHVKSGEALTWIQDLLR